jgi:hypothetical protein
LGATFYERKNMNFTYQKTSPFNNSLYGFHYRIENENEFKELLQKENCSDIGSELKLELPSKYPCIVTVWQENNGVSDRGYLNGYTTLGCVCYDMSEWEDSEKLNEMFNSF